MEKAVAIVSGRKVDLPIGASFPEVMMKLAQEHGLKNFRLRVADSLTGQLVELSVEQAPPTIWAPFSPLRMMSS